MKAALSELPNVSEVTHDAGTDTFVVRHTGQLTDAARAVNGKVLFRWARRWLEALARKLRRATG
ncbi:MAG: hypothetical protein HY870_19120 [Chloroflexi bacterium]|nr:hypothetical protein [Chloroflexota bacterium]